VITVLRIIKLLLVEKPLPRAGSIILPVNVKRMRRMMNISVVAAFGTLISVVSPGAHGTFDACGWQIKPAHRRILADRRHTEAFSGIDRAGLPFLPAPPWSVFFKVAGVRYGCRILRRQSLFVLLKGDWLPNGHLSIRRRGAGTGIPHAVPSLAISAANRF
jgi:hypothetical protein